MFNVCPTSLRNVSKVNHATYLQQSCLIIVFRSFIVELENFLTMTRLFFLSLWNFFCVKKLVGSLNQWRKWHSWNQLLSNFQGDATFISVPQALQMLWKFLLGYGFLYRDKAELLSLFCTDRKSAFPVSSIRKCKQNGRKKWTFLGLLSKPCGNSSNNIRRRKYVSVVDARQLLLNWVR